MLSLYVLCDRRDENDAPLYLHPRELWEILNSVLKSANLNFELIFHPFYVKFWNFWYLNIWGQGLFLEFIIIWVLLGLFEIKILDLLVIISDDNPYLCIDG